MQFCYCAFVFNGLGTGGLNFNSKTQVDRQRVSRSALLLAGVFAVLAACQSSSITSGLQSASKETDGWTGPQAGVLKPFKERQFQYRKPLEVSDGGRFLKLPYSEETDINKRDVIPVRKTKSWYVKPLPADAAKTGEISAGGRKIAYHALGRTDGGSKMTVIYVHGRGGNKDWGFDDERFGGNFNRLKNLLLENGGTYISTDFTDFEGQGFQDIKALVAKFRPLTSGPVVVACGSLGNQHCWNLTHDAATSSQVDGIIILAGFPDPRFMGSAVASQPARHIPLVIGHGSWDPDYDYKDILAFWRRLREARPGYPTRFLLFETGKHGSPIRMIDWRDTLNWIASK